MRLVALGVLTVFAAPALAAQEAHPVQVIQGLKQPESAAFGPDGRLYVSQTGEYEKANDGVISIVDLRSGTVLPFATGLDDPHGIKWWRNYLFVSDNMGLVWRIDAKGGVERFVDATDFPRKITNFNDIEIDPAGNIYLSDSGDWEGRGGVIYRITQERKISVVLSDDDDWRLLSPNGLLMDGADKLLVVDYTTGNLFRVDLGARPATMEKVAGGFGASDGLVRDPAGRLILGDFTGHRIFRLPEAKPATRPREMTIAGIESAADFTLASDGQTLIIPDMNGGRIAVLRLAR